MNAYSMLPFRSTLAVAFAVVMAFFASSSLQPALSNDCNGVWQEDVDPYDPMECHNVSCSESCSMGSQVLSPDTTVYWCQCGTAGGEPTCCHTIQKTINGQWQQPTGWGTCSGSCGGGDCRGGSSTGFSCQ
jgi:hypothetical protein